jgi:hypothetical protein
MTDSGSAYNHLTLQLLMLLRCDLMRPHGTAQHAQPNFLCTGTFMTHERSHHTNMDGWAPSGHADMSTYEHTTLVLHLTTQSSSAQDTATVPPPKYAL